MVGESESTVSAGLAGLLSWLDRQGFGVSTYVAFCAYALELGDADAAHAATGRLLADLAQQFVDAYDNFEAFASENGARFYGLPLSSGMLTLRKRPDKVAVSVPVDDEEVIIFRGDETPSWSLGEVKP